MPSGFTADVVTYMHRMMPVWLPEPAIPIHRAPLPLQDMQCKVPVWCMSTISLVWSSSWAMRRDLMMSSVTRPARGVTTSVGSLHRSADRMHALQSGYLSLDGAFANRNSDVITMLP